MQLKVLRAELEAAHLGKMQEQELCRAAVQMLEEGLNILSRLGHPMKVDPGADLTELWPRMVFRYGEPPRLVASEFELYDLGEGWYDTAAAAEEAHGRAAQFAGRGGVQRTGLPTIYTGR